jgi:adenylate cyclase class 2
MGRKLRLRRHGNDIALLTLKGPRLNGTHKARMEVETPVSYEAAKRILELLGYRVNETYSKLREEYRLDGCPVCLDHIPECGWFVEIEGASKQIAEIARRLGLRPADRERRSYRKLLKEVHAA